MNAHTYTLLTKIFSYRKFYLYSLIACALILSASFFVEHYLFYLPCPLCILQRICYMVIGITSLLACLHNPKKLFKYLYPIFTIFISFLGIALTIRQIYLQHLPKDQLPSCLGGLLDILNSHPLLEALGQILQGGAECGDTSLLIFGLTMATWSLLLFIAFALTNTVCIIKMKK